MLADFNNFLYRNQKPFARKIRQGCNIFHRTITLLLHYLVKLTLVWIWTLQQRCFTQRLLWFPTNLAQQRDHHARGTTINGAYTIVMFFGRNCCQRLDVFQGRMLSSSRTVHHCTCTSRSSNSAASASRNSGLHFSLQTCGLQTVQISIQLTMRSGLWCIVVFTWRKLTPSTNWSMHQRLIEIRCGLEQSTVG